MQNFRAIAKIYIFLHLHIFSFLEELEKFHDQIKQNV